MHRWDLRSGSGGRRRMIERRRTVAGFLAVVAIAGACSSTQGGEVRLAPTTTSTSAPEVEESAVDDAADDPADDATADAPDGDEVPLNNGLDLPPTQIRVDQFGYRPGDPKVAVIVDPEIGYDADVDHQPGETIEVRRFDDDQVVFEGEPVPWADGEVSPQSGDRGWWFDFSPVDESGTYYLIDPSTDDRTGPFEVGADVYDGVLEAALRMFWFNRGNADHPAELAGPWADGPAYVGPDQDPGARWVDDRGDAGTALDLSGGWFDAGDTNKYVTFASEPVHSLLTAYRRHPDVFDDSSEIPESGNGIPDVVDEVRWEIGWLERMQLDDGGVLTKVGVIEGENRLVPSEATRPRYYEEACSSSTIVAAGMFAHAAVVFSQFPALADDAARLQERAEDAWNWYQDNERGIECDDQIVRAGDADISLEEQDSAEVVAAIYLFALTGAQRYDRVVVANHDDTLPFRGDGFGNYGPDQAQALLYYRTLGRANRGVVASIERRLAEVQSSPLFGFDDGADLYRAYLPDTSYHWGSNMVKANVGWAALAVGQGRQGRERALGHLQYFHGINPFGLVYLTNMEDLGAERSAQHLFHYWFGEKTNYDVARGSEHGVAPGYVVGGPNHSYSGGAAPPAGQPPQKSYWDWSAYGSEPSWEITEPAIYYQAAYVGLLAAVIDS